MNGELAVDFPEDVKIPIEPNQMATATLSGSRIKFSYCDLERAIVLLKEQYAIGTVEVKVVQPRSKVDPMGAKIEDLSVPLEPSQFLSRGH